MRVPSCKPHGFHPYYDCPTCQQEKIDALLAHCPDGECPVCAKIICPYQCDMHFHHDGCPACAEHEGENNVRR